MELKIKKAQAELRNVNLRTENNGDERVLAIDLKIKANCSAKEVAPLFQDTPDLLNTLFEEGGNVLNPVIEFAYRVPIENVEVQIDDLKSYKGCRVKKNMLLIPRNGKRFELTFTVQMHDVADVRSLAKRLHEEIKVSITELQQSLSLDPKDDDAPPKSSSKSTTKAKPKATPTPPPTQPPATSNVTHLNA